jgi:hypothetical protein
MRRLTFGFVLVGGIALLALGQVEAGRDRNPASPGDRNGREFRMTPETTPPPAQQRPLRIDSIQVQRSVEGSALGSAGDLLITFNGQGFMLTSLSPRVVLTPELVLEMTEVNGDGTELYVVLPRDLVSRVEAARFDSVVVINPGGLEDSPYVRASARATAARLLRPDPGVPAVRVVYREGVFSREPARQ